MSYLIFENFGTTPSGKTDRDYVKSQNHEILGGVSWYGPWRKYVFTAAGSQFIFDANCLREIADYCEKKTKEYKAK